MQSSVGHEKSDLKVKLALIACLATFASVVGIGIAVYPSSSMAAETADWQAYAQANGYSETHDPPSLITYLLAGIEYIGKSVHVA